jgi:type IV secretory pathway VirB3-like protein
MPMAYRTNGRARIYQPLLGVKMTFGVPDKVAYTIWILVSSVAMHMPALLVLGVVIHGAAAALALKDPHIFFFLRRGLFPKRLDP